VSPTIVANAASARLGGGLNTIVRQLSALERVRPDLSLRVLGAPWNIDALREALEAPVQLVPVPAASARFAYEQIVLPWRLRRQDVLYCPGNFSPLLPHRSRTVLVLQNPNYVGEGPAQQSNQGRNRRLKIRLCQQSLRTADRVIVVSHALRATLLTDLPEVADRTIVIQSGGAVWPDREQAPAGFPRQTGHLLTLANDYPHKNLDAVVDAWARCFDGRSGAAPTLVLAGDITEARRETHRQRVPLYLRGRLVHVGPVADRAEVRWLLAHALAMVAPSALEAFPLTPAEAGSLGCPVILSDIPAHREVAGDHATYVPVGDIDGLARAIGKVVDRPPRRKPWTLRETWESNARALAAVFDELTGTPSRPRTTRRAGERS
jgi:glycosyltransferase involved in cell wall biosynthesis